MNEKKKSATFKRNVAAIFCGAVGSQTMYVFMYNYSLIFFTDFLGVAAGVASAIFFLSRIWDAINDPMCGALIEKTDTRFGKVQPWLFGGAVISAISLIALFTVPGMGLTGRTIWGTLSYNFMGMAFTAVTVSIMVQMPRSTRIGKERVNLAATYTIGCSVAGIIVASLVTKGLAFFGKTEPSRGYLIVAILCGVGGAVFLLGDAFAFRDQETINEKNLKAAGIEVKKPKIKDMISAVIHTQPFFVIVAVFLLFNIGNGVSNSAMIYYFNYTVGKPEYMQVMLPLLYVGTFAASIVLGYLSKFGKKRVCQAACILIAVTNALRWFFADYGLVVNAVLFCINGIGYGIFIGYLQPLLMDCADYAEHRSGTSCQALTLTGYTLCSKMAGGAGVAILGAVLQVTGYVGTQAVQPDSALRAIGVMHLGIPVIIGAVAFFVLFFYRLDDKTMEDIRRQKSEKEQAEIEAVQTK